MAIRPIITYQKKLGNYNVLDEVQNWFSIITYQKKLGNYNLEQFYEDGIFIITYQEKLGNYNYRSDVNRVVKL